MKKESLLWKQGTIFVVILFCGLAFAPSIHANISKESELVDITTEVCGLPGQKPQTVQLTIEDAEAVDRLFEEIKLKLDNVESREEAIEIFNEAIMELDKYGLLGGLGVKQAQRLVSGWYQKPGKMSYLEGVEDDSNLFCMIFANIKDTDFISIDYNLFSLIAVLLYELRLWRIGWIILKYSFVKPFRFMNAFGTGNFDDENNAIFRTLGLLGYKRFMLQKNDVLAIFGFTGLAIKRGYYPDEYSYIDYCDAFYLGFALWVRAVYN